MKKSILVITLCVTLILVLCSSCNRQVFDLTYQYNNAILNLPDSSIVKGRVSSWKDYEGDQLQIVIDGVTYLIHSSDAVLMSK